MMTFPQLPAERLAGYEAMRQNIAAGYDETIVAGQARENTALSTAADRARQLQEIDTREAEEALRHSLAGRIGIAVETVSHLAGFDWRTNIALIGGFAAKEVIISTLGTAYSMGEVDTEQTDSLGERLKKDANWNRVVAVAALVFIMFYAPCFVTVVCIAREASWRWALFSIGFNTVFAFILAVLVFKMGSFFHLG
jgi:ferrous iron transport protein B